MAKSLFLVVLLFAVCLALPAFAEFQFAAYGDSRTGTSIHSDIVSMIVADDPAFVIHTGDFVGTGGTWSEWQSQFLDIAQPLLDHAPSPGLTTFFYPSIGNHETRGTGWATNYFNVFNVDPVNQYYYSFDYQNAHFVSLYVTNTWNPSDFDSGSAQYAWLAADLAQASADPNIKWKFVFFHAPVFSCIASHACGRNIQEHLVPLFDQHDVTAVFGGDDHSYQRIGPIKDYLPDPIGTSYIITAGAGASLYSFYSTTNCNLHEGRSDMPCDPSWTGMPNQAFPLAAGEISYHYTRLTVRDDDVIGEVIRRDGSLLETFTMQNDAVDPVCVNNVKEAGEVCDGTDLDGEGCQSQGFDSGTLSCLPNCLGFNTSQCVACGNGLREGSEECDDDNLVDGDGCSSLCTLDSCGVDVGADSCTGLEYCPTSFVPSADSASCCSSTCQQVSSDVIYVDNTISDCGSYNPGSRTCGGGSDISYNTLDDGSAAAGPGNTVIVRGGTYNNWFRVQQSGSPGSPITIRNYSGETPTINLGGSGVGILIENKDYLVIEGLTISDVWAWGQVIDSSNIIFRNNTFEYAEDHGSRGSLRFVNSNYNKVLNNSFDYGNDNLLLENSNNNLIEGNTFYSGRHTLLNVSCGNYNVIRDNTFDNPIQKIGETFDCEGVIESLYDDTRQVRRLDATKRNIWEQNRFIYTAIDRIDGDGSIAGPFNGIQYAGQQGIIRNNVFYNNMGGGVELTLYSDEAMNDYENRVYNNVFFENRFAGIRLGRSTSYNFYDNIMKNNIVYKNDFVNWNGVYNRWGWANADGRPIQIHVMASGPPGYLFENNNILSTGPGQDDTISHPDYYEDGEPSSAYSLAWWEQNYSAQFRNNLEEDPQFEDETNHNFNLSSSSTMVDAGAFLTTTANTGNNSTTMIVDDAFYFYDGYDIDGEQGDIIQLDGQTQTARITNANYTTNTLTLSSPLTWTSGQSLSLAYNGARPDIGAFESTGTGCVTRTILSTRISQWEQGNMTMPTLISNIERWKAGTGCP